MVLPPVLLSVPSVLLSVPLVPVLLLPLVLSVFFERVGKVALPPQRPLSDPCSSVRRGRW